MKLTEILNPKAIKVPLAATDKTQAITELVDLLAQHELVQDRDALLQAVLTREATASTGIGRGLAVPHGKSPACDRLVMAIGKPASPMDFASRDGCPAEIIVLLGSPLDKTGPHIQALASITRLMLLDKFRSAIAAAESPEALYQVIADHET